MVAAPGPHGMLLAVARKGPAYPVLEPVAFAPMLNTWPWCNSRFKNAEGITASPGKSPNRPNPLLEVKIVPAGS